MKPDHKKRKKGDPRPPGYWKGYEQGQKISGKLFKTGFRQVQKAADKFLEDHPGYGPQIRCALTNWIMMKIYTLSTRRLVEEHERKPSIRRDAGLTHVPSKSRIHKWLGQIPVSLLDSLLTLTAGSAAFCTLSVDSTQYTYNRYVLVEDTKHGKYYRKDTIKHHVLIAETGRIVSSVVTCENAHDSPMLVKLCAEAPRGNGYFLRDSAYCSVRNCKLEQNLGGKPCMPPKKSYGGRGFGPWARMIK